MLGVLRVVYVRGPVERGIAADRHRSKGNKEEKRKESRAARGPRLKGEREQLALPKAIKV